MISSFLVLSGVWLSDRIRDVGSRRENISRAGGVCGEESSQQRVHLAVEHHLWGRRPVHLFWTQPQRKGQEPQCHLQPDCGGRVWVAKIFAGNVWWFMWGKGLIYFPVLITGLHINEGVRQTLMICCSVREVLHNDIRISCLVINAIDIILKICPNVPNPPFIPAQ